MLIDTMGCKRGNCRRRVVITGMGAVSPNGVGAEAFWRSVRNGVSGVDTLRCLKKELPATPVIVLTMFELPVYKETVEANGASGYVIKRSMIETLLPTIREVCSEKEKSCPGWPD